MARRMRMRYGDVQDVSTENRDDEEGKEGDEHDHLITCEFAAHE